MQATDTEDHLHNTQSRVIGEWLAKVMRDVREMEKLHRLAERYGGLPRDSPNAEQLVLDVIEDVFSGDAKCDVNSEQAPQQLRRHVVRHSCRYRNAARSGLKKRPRPVFVALEKAPPSALGIEPAQRYLYDDDHVPFDPAELLPLLREYSREDGAVRQLLAHYERGEVSRRELLAAGMTEWVYRAARKRLDVYAERAMRAISARRTSMAAASEMAEGARAPSQAVVPASTRSDGAPRAPRGAGGRTRRAQRLTRRSV
jgi:hypothetical protein